jgi:serine/threonine-protein kinase
LKPKLSRAAPGVSLGALNLSVDLGPEPSLTDSLGPTRNRAKPKETENERDGPKPAAAAESSWGRKADLVAGLGLPREWLVPAAGAAALVLALGGALVVYRSVAGGGETPPANGHGGASNGNSRGGTEAPDFPAPNTVAKSPTRPTLKGQEVEAVAADETMSVQPDFRRAVLTAIGSRGYVLLRNARPLRIKAETIVASGGPLTIRAGDGARPVLEVVVRRGKPFLLTRPNSPLRIEGVTVVVYYADEGPEPPPVIDAGASVTLDRCAFRVEGPERGLVAGSRAVVMEGGSLIATGCWFENFDRALDLATFSGSTASITQCMFIHNRRGGEGPAASADTNSDTNTNANTNGPAGGWAVRLRSMPGGAPKVGRKLVMDHCTAHGRGFLDFAGFSDLAPARVDLRGCAVLADALVAWETVTPTGTPAAPPSRDCLSWLGEGDQFDIRGKSWLLLAPRDAPPEAMPGGPVDLEGWNRAFGTERDPVLPPLRFAADPSAIPEHPTPADFAVATDKGSSRTIGADPAQVGPTALPHTPSRKSSRGTKADD